MPVIGVERRLAAEVVAGVGEKLKRMRAQFFRLHQVWHKTFVVQDKLYFGTALTVNRRREDCARRGVPYQPACSATASVPAVAGYIINADAAF